MTTKLELITARRRTEFNAVQYDYVGNRLPEKPVDMTIPEDKPATPGRTLLIAHTRRSKRTDQVWAAMVIPLILQDRALTDFRYPVDPFKAIRKSKFFVQTYADYAKNWQDYHVKHADYQSVRVEDSVPAIGVDPEIAAGRKRTRSYSAIAASTFEPIQRQGRHVEIAPTVTEAPQGVRFALQEPPHHKVRIIAGKLALTILLPIADLDLADPHSAAEVRARLANCYRTACEYRDDEGIATGVTFEAGRQDIARKLEWANKLMATDGAMYVWEGMDALVATAIHKAVKAWHKQPQPPASTGDGRKTEAGYTNSPYNSPVGQGRLGLDQQRIVGVVVRTRYLNWDGVIAQSAEPKIAVYDQDSELFYFEDYTASSEKFLEGTWEDVPNQLVPAYEIARYIPVRIHENGTLAYLNTNYWTEHSVETAPSTDSTIWMVELKYAVANWRDDHQRSDIKQALPSRRQYLSDRIKFKGNHKLITAPSGLPTDADTMTREQIYDLMVGYRHDDLSMSEAEAGFDDFFLAREAEMALEDSLDKMRIVEKPLHESHANEDAYELFVDLVTQATDRELHVGKERPVLTYKFVITGQPAEFRIKPKGARLPLVSMTVVSGARWYKRRCEEIVAAAMRRPLGPVTAYTNFDRQAHDEACKTVYVGQGWKLQEGNILANGPIGNPEKYREWLKQVIREQTPAYRELANIADHVARGKHLRLVAWPLVKKGESGRGKPAPAYVDVIIAAVRYLARKLQSDPAFAISMIE